jgi:hypothetical protein
MWQTLVIQPGMTRAFGLLMHNLEESLDDVL